MFDCPAKYGDVSLNGDIKSMFHQVKVPAEQRDVLRFLWWKNEEIGSSLVTYRMTVHLFGVVWSPSCAAYALARTAQDNRENFKPEVTVAVGESFYVDDCLVSCQNEVAAIALVKDLC